MFLNENISSHEAIVNSLNSIRLYWQSTYSSYEDLMEDIANDIDPNDPNLKDDLIEQGL